MLPRATIVRPRRLIALLALTFALWVFSLSSLILRLTRGKLCPRAPLKTNATAACGAMHDL